MATQAARLNFQLHIRHPKADPWRQAALSLVLYLALSMAMLLPGLAALAPVSARAQPIDNKVSQVITLFDAIASHPGPSWQSTDNLLGSEVNRSQQGPSFILEQIPKGEAFKSWKRLYGVFALKQPGLGLNDFINMSLAPFLNACGKENFFANVVEKKETSLLVRVICQNTPQAPPNIGYGEGIGEISLIWFGQSGSTLVKIYQQWRGAKFDANAIATWPVSTDELQGMSLRLSTAALQPAPPR